MANSRSKETHGIYYNKLTEQTARDKVNVKLSKISSGNVYYDKIPWGRIMEAVTSEGFDGALLSNIMIGDGGRINAHVGGKTYLLVTWYKMPASGKFEVIAYVS